MKKIIFFALIALTLCGCGKKEEIEETSKSIIATDFVTYDVARNLAKDTDFNVELIEDTDELSGRDRNKINKSLIFINTKGIPDVDENKTIDIFSFIDQKENNKDDNKVYSEVSLIIKEEKQEISEESVTQVVVKPNKNNETKPKNSENINNSENSESPNKPDNAKIDENSETENIKEAQGLYLKDGAKVILCKSTFDSAPTSSDKNGYSLGNYPIGYKVRETNDEYSKWLCDRINNLSKDYVTYAGIDNGDGTYTLFRDDTALTTQYKVITVDEIIITESFGEEKIYFEDTLGSKFSSLDKKILAATVDMSTDYWLDINNTILLAEKIKDKLIEVDPENKNIYDENYKTYINDLETISDKIKYIVDNSENKTIFIGGEFNYKYFTDCYGINYVSLYDYSSEELPSLTRLSNFAKILNKYKIKYVIKDKEASMEGINSIKTELDYNLNTVIIDSMQSATIDDSYLDIMNNNYIILKKAIY